MKILDAISKFFRREPKEKTRGFSELVAGGSGINADWNPAWTSDDADLLNNAWALVGRVRDLFNTNTTFQSYRESFIANVYGSNGIMLRSTVKETEDRVIHTPEEKGAIRAYEERRNRVLEWAASKNGIEWKRELNGYRLLRELGDNGSRAATVKVGEPDVFARTLIERKWREFGRKEFCDVRGTRNMHTMRQIRGISTVRDGDFFTHIIRDPRANKFGITLRMINSEWCDRTLNHTLENGNVIRMGIEYQMNGWGIGKPVAYHFIKRQPRDWQFTIAGSYGYRGGQLHERIPADEIIHHARPFNAESTRPAPWVASTIPKARQLDQYELAEVVAARAQACKTGYLYSDINPDGGAGGMEINPADSLPTQQLSPGDIFALKYGVKYGQTDPTHPNGNAENFRKMMLRSQCAGMPGSSYPTIAHDYEAVNFSAGRLARLDSNELFKMIQVWDIDQAETPIFEAWLEMSLMTGAIPLPLAKMEKFNSKTFQGRRWRGIDEVKEAQAAALRIANKLSSRTRENLDIGNDFEEVLFELAEEEMAIEAFGLKTETTVETPAQTATETDEESDAQDAGTPAKKTLSKKKRLTIAT